MCLFLLVCAAKVRTAILPGGEVGHRAGSSVSLKRSPSQVKTEEGEDIESENSS